LTGCLPTYNNCSFFHAAFPQCSFDHWQLMNGDVFTPGNKVFEIIKDTRKRKGLKEELPPLDEYLDKL
jgi:elongation factor 2